MGRTLVTHDLGSVRDSEPRAIPSATADGRTEAYCSPARGQYASNLPFRSGSGSRLAVEAMAELIHRRGLERASKVLIRWGS